MIYIITALFLGIWLCVALAGFVNLDKLNNRRPGRALEDQAFCAVCFGSIDTEHDAFEYANGEYYCHEHMSPETAELEQ